MVGRETEVASVEAFFDATVMLPGALLLEGEPGIGKTTLWKAGVQAARARGFRVVACSPSGSETELSFAALRDLLDDVFGEVESELPAPQRRALAVALLRVDPASPRSEQGAIMAAVLGTLRTLARSAPVALAVDDVQWLDAPSAAALTFAVRRLRKERVGLLLARRVEREATPPLDLERAFPARLQVVPVGPLSLGAIHALLHARLGVVLSRPTLRRLHELCGGNPFYALELARALEQGIIHLESGEPLPPDLRELVGARLTVLPKQTQDLLALAAAVSRPTTRLLEAAWGEEISAALEPAVLVQVVEVEGVEVRFGHPLLAAAAYALVPPRERRDLHRRLAAVAEGVEERARHLAQASELPEEEVASAIEEGAKVAFRRGAPAAAAELAGQARRLTPDPSTKKARRRALMQAESLFEAGDTGQATVLLDEVIERSPVGVERARVLSRQARYRHFGEDAGAGVELLRLALAEAGDDPVLRTEIEEGLAWGLLLMRRDLPTAAAHARSAVRFAKQTGDQAALAEALAAQALAEFVLGHEAAATMERALELESATLHLRVLRHPSFAYGYLLSCTDELDRAREVFRELHRRASDHGDESALPPILNHLAFVRLLAGAWEEAERLLNEAYTVALQSGQGPSQASILSKKALLTARRGLLAEASEFAENALELSAGPAFEVARPERALARGGETAIWTLGFIELSRGNPVEAHRYLGSLRETLMGAGIEEPGELRFLPDEVESLATLGQFREAKALVDWMDQITRRLGRPSALASAHRCRGVVAAAGGDMRSALAALEQARTEQERVALPFELGQTLLALGKAQRRAKQRAAARETLQRTAATFERLGALGCAETARSELARIGGRTPSGGALTPTERRVAELVAVGHSNKQVAAALFVTTKTVEGNLSRIYAKLGIHSRTELARRMVREAPTSKL
jgi:DNA-binding CsgD family transcriptional regulator